MRSYFGLNALAEAAEGDARPGKVLVQMVYAQKCQQELKYIPWKRILSESSKALPSEIVPFLALLADAAGHADPPEQEPSSSPLGDQRLLTTCWVIGKNQRRAYPRAGGAPCEKGMLCIQEDRQVLLW